MENVIQMYLRNEFDSIQEYNAHAGEVAEPFQILVVANFPANFTEEAARRLVSIAASGARCGVYTLISVDTKMKLPRNFDLADLAAARRDARSGADERFCWRDADLRPAAAGRWSCRRTATGSRRSSGPSASAPRTPTASRCRSPRSSPPEDQWWTARQPRRKSTCRWAAPGPPSCSTCGWARAPRSTC